MRWNVKGNQYEFGVVILLFFIALLLRLTYQSEAVIKAPIQKDAREYVSAAYNLYHFGIYSTKPPKSDHTPPSPDFRRPPGYPLFLYPFVVISRTGQQFLYGVTTAQAVMGSLTVLLTFFLGRLILRPLWAALSALFTALSPHLVAMDHFILSESLFTFTISLATLVLALSLKKPGIGLSLITGILFGLSVMIRPIALLLGPWLCLVYLMQLKRRSIRVGWRLPFIQIACLLTGYMLIYAPYLFLRNRTVAKGFSVSDQPVWHRVVGGMDVNMKNFIRAKTDPLLRAERDKMANDKKYALKRLAKRFAYEPFQYLKWYLGGKLVFMWRWNNIYHGGPGGIGDVYHYPMIKRGFHTHAVLKVIHKTMRLIHWPLYILTLISPFLLWVRWRKDEPDASLFFAIPPLLVFLYFSILLTILAPLPRYAIPVRPFAYVLAIFGLHQLVCLGRPLIPRLKSILISSSSECNS